MTHINKRFVYLLRRIILFLNEQVLGFSLRCYRATVAAATVLPLLLLLLLLLLPLPAEVPLRSTAALLVAPRIPSHSPPAWEYSSDMPVAGATWRQRRGIACTSHLMVPSPAMQCHCPFHCPLIPDPRR